MEKSKFSTNSSFCFVTLEMCFIINLAIMIYVEFVKNFLERLNIFFCLLMEDKTDLI